MNNFIKKMLELGEDLAKTESPMKANIIINDAEILYEKERKEIINEIKTKYYEKIKRN